MSFEVLSLFLSLFLRGTLIPFPRNRIREGNRASLPFDSTLPLHLHLAKTLWQSRYESDRGVELKELKKVERRTLSFDVDPRGCFSASWNYRWSLNRHLFVPGLSVWFLRRLGVVRFFWSSRLELRRGKKFWNCSNAFTLKYVKIFYIIIVYCYVNILFRKDRRMQISSLLVE